MSQRGGEASPVRQSFGKSQRFKQSPSSSKRAHKSLDQLQKAVAEDPEQGLHEAEQVNAMLLDAIKAKLALLDKLNASNKA